MLHFTALVTMLACAFLFATGIKVALVRVKTGVKAPATTGNAEFERAYRVQMNTLEWMPIMLPALWLFGLYVSDVWAAVLGIVWIGGRIVYMRGYLAAAEQRGPGFAIQASAVIILWAGAVTGVVLAIIKVH